MCNDTGCPIPYGSCHCGCGQNTKQALRNDPRDRVIAGQPVRYLRGHSGGRPRTVDFVIREDHPTGLCACGCGQITPVANVTRKRRGQYKGLPSWYVPGHAHRAAPTEYVEEDRGYVTPCWIWQLRLNEKGYAMSSKKGRCSYPAYRKYWESVNGPFPIGKEPHHRCRVRSCVRPDHIQPVTHCENVQMGSGKLTPDQVLTIRYLHPRGEKDRRATAARYGVSYSAIKKLLGRSTWKNLPLSAGEALR